jgi:cell wall-associated NlpC family hydrolase
MHGYYKWFSARGQADSLPPQKGDLVVYGPQYAHIAIYVGEGRAISTLLDGVRVHDAATLSSIEPDERMPVEAYLHIRPDEEVHSEEQLCP